jgi:NtrC-family two-component system sensor histidine kinase KinB
MTRPLQLRTRVAVAGAILVGVTLITGAWSTIAFRRVSRIAGETVQADKQITDATSALSGALEREDDGLLLALSNPVGGQREIAARRRDVDRALRAVDRALVDPAERMLYRTVEGDVSAYHAATDQLAAAPAGPDPRVRYHEVVNPLLRRAVTAIDQIRDAHFRSSQAAAAQASRTATRSMATVGVISAIAVLVFVAIVLHLARVLLLPLRAMTNAVKAFRRGEFTRRIDVGRDDELGRLASDLNEMADELERFRRANIGEVLRAKATLEATLEALPDAVAVIDPDRRVSSANPQAVRVLGPVDARGVDELELAASTRSLIDDVLRSGAFSDASVDLSRTQPIELDGSRHHLLPRVVPIGHGRGAVLVLSDVTQLVRIDELRSELVAVASHELRTPLTTLRMTLSMIQERTAAYEAPVRELVATAMVGVDQLSTVVDEFLDLTQIEAGRLRLHWSRVSLLDLVTELAKSFEASCEVGRVDLAVHLPDALDPQVAADRRRLAAVLRNLLANALEYTPAGGRIDISARVDESREHAVVEVADTGRGIAPEYRERVFDKFFRVHEDHASGHGAPGVGIGLYVARQIMQAHGGSIRCVDTPSGARFVIELPLESPLAPASPS